MYKNLKKYIPILSILLLAPFTFSQSLGDLTFKTLLEYLTNILTNTLIPAIGAIFFFIFVYSFVKFIFYHQSGSNEEEMRIAKKALFRNIIIVFIVFSIWGFVALFRFIVGG